MKRTVGILIVAIVIALCSIQNASSIDHVTIQRGDRSIELDGEVVVDAQNGDLMLRSRNGRIWMIQAAEISSRTSDDAEFTGLTREETRIALLAEFPEGFDVYQTKHYVICHDTSDAFAKWVGGLYERLRAAFTNYWQQRGFPMVEADTPQVVVIFGTRESYARYATKELGADPGGMVAYYNVESNRVMMHDLTGTDALTRRNARKLTSAQINNILKRPASATMVATVVHEATHQLAFNAGLQTRFADWPFWVSEGLAMYFETPSLTSKRGWSGLGKVNRDRLVQMRSYGKSRPGNSLETLIRDDKRFREADGMLDTYAEAWSLNYFLINKHRDEYFGYLKSLGENTPLMEDTPEERLAEFKKHFGDDLQKLDKEFAAYMSKLR